jgi:hypothetical protein
MGRESDRAMRAVCICVYMSLQAFWDLYFNLLCVDLRGAHHANFRLFLCVLSGGVPLCVLCVSWNQCVLRMGI